MKREGGGEERNGNEKKEENKLEVLVSKSG